MNLRLDIGGGTSGEDGPILRLFCGGCGWEVVGRSDAVAIAPDWPTGHVDVVHRVCIPRWQTTEEPDIRQVYWTGDYDGLLTTLMYQAITERKLEAASHRHIGWTRHGPSLVERLTRGI